jgi:uncharacterized protein YkwD
VPTSRKRKSRDGRPVRARTSRAATATATALEPERRVVYLGDEVQRDAEDEVVRLTNELRIAHGLRPVQPSEALRRAARAHSADMGMRRFFDHLDPDGRTPFERMRAHGHPRPAAENLAHGQRTAQEVMQDWIRSPGHRANLLIADARFLGVGFSRSFWTQNFGY